MLWLCVVPIACKTLPANPGDTTPAQVKLDVHGSGYEEAYPNSGTPGVTSECCLFRLTVPSLNPLTFVASAEDPESGVALLEIEAVVIRRCQDVDLFGNPSAVRLFEERLSVGSTGAAAGATGQPATRLVNGAFRMADQEAGLCPRATVQDQFGTHTVERTLLRFCGVRMRALAQNGAGVAGTTRAFLMVPGVPDSGAFPCPEVPF